MQDIRFSNAPVPLSADVYLSPYSGELEKRSKHIKAVERRLRPGSKCV